MNLHLFILVGYSVGMVALGLIIGRRVRGTSDFFVARRQLGPGLIFSTMLAANIGAGSTVGATAIGYSGGIAAWWWVGSAAIGSIALALWVGPAMRRVAQANDLRTVGDYLEFRYNAAVRGVVSALLLTTVRWRSTASLKRKPVSSSSSTSLPHSMLMHR